MKKREVIACITITNTTALFIFDIDACERVEYCVATDGETVPKSHHAKINYTIRDNAPYINTIIGRMHLSQAMKITPVEV